MRIFLSAPYFAGICVLITVTTFTPCFTNINTKIPMAKVYVKSQPSQKKPGGLSERVSVRAAGRGNPWVNVEDGRDLLTQYDDVQFNKLLSRGGAAPLSLTSSDFDEDGVPDLVGGFRSGTGGLITLHIGNVDSIYSNSPEAKRKANGEYAGSPFLSPALIFPVPEPPDFISAGDFDGDSHLDVVTAARGSNVLYLLSGDGLGNLGDARKVELAGRVTAMVCGDINRRDGLADLVVAVTGPQGNQALVFESPEGALRGEPEAIALPAEASALAIGQLDDDYAIDLAIAAGKELLIVPGRARRLSLDEAKRAQVAPARVERITLPSKCNGMAIGDFVRNYHSEIALLSEEGRIQLVSRKNKKWAVELLAGGTFAETSQIICARVSSLPYDNLVLVDAKDNQLHILIDNQPNETRDLQSDSSTVRPLIPVTLDVEDTPVAVLPMRLNGDALSDLVVLKNGADPIAVALTAPMSTFMVTNTDDSGLGSLRQAITDANIDGGLDKITFNISGSGVHTITPHSALRITNPVMIDGYTQQGSSPNTLASGNNAVILIELNGSSAPSNGLGLQANAGGSTIRGLVINRFPDNGISLGSVSDNIIEGNFIGTNAAGTADLGNAFVGVDIGPGSNNTVGGTAAAARNIISGNNEVGVNIFGNSSTGNKVQGNFIGTDASGTAAIANSRGGIVVQSAPNSTIGGTVAAARNIISGNNSDGIELFSGTLGGNLVQSNFIGTDVNGVASLRNTGAGVNDGGSSNTIGGTVAAAQNIISGNGQDGVAIGASGSGNQIQGNFIGTNLNGTAKLGNTGSGVYLEQASNNIIGGTIAGARNLISGNNSHGVLLSNGGPGGNQVQGNFIGTDANGTAALSNAGEGVFVSFSRNTAIGGSTTGTGNVIAFNDARGVYVRGGASTGNSILGNSIHSNSALGIDLDPVGVTANDSCDADTGANNLQNFPILSSASTRNVQGMLNSTASTNFRIEFFVNPACDSSGNGEGKTFLGATTVATNSNCNVSFGFTFPIPVMQGQVITATATDLNGNTSEFSPCVPVTGMCTYSFSPTSQSFAANGGTGTLNVTAGPGCTWTATTSDPWITINSGSPGSGDGTVNYTVAANPGPNTRSGAITVAGATISISYIIVQGIPFLDVPTSHPFYTEIGKLSARGVTLGCGNGNYCPNDPVTREQMAAFIMRAKGEFNPPTPPSQRFNDVPQSSPFYSFIDRLAVLQITLGCTPDHLMYCPADPVKREQMAAFIMRGLGEFDPPTPLSQRFNDVPPSNPFYNFIDRLAALQVTQGCTPDHLMYCPNDSVTRGQMAAFLVRAFGL